MDTHKIETESKNIIRSIVDADGVGLFRDLTERDYGIDAIVEVFNEGAITGKFALMQCKGQAKKIEPLKTNPEYVSCSGISASNIDYADQGNSVVILAYSSTSEKDNFYFVKLSDAVGKKHKAKINVGQKYITVHIPIQNNTRDNMELFWNIIHEFYT